MYKIKRRRHKPIYKKFIRLRANVLFKKRLQLFKFKKQKWKRLSFFIKRMLYRRKKNFRAYDINRYYLPKFYNPFNRKYKMVSDARKRVRLFYGLLSKRYMKKQVNLALDDKKKQKKNQFFLSLMERRLDVILYRTHFLPSVRNGQQLILHKHIRVNNINVTNPSYKLKNGDTITINHKIKHIINNNILKSIIWPLPPKYLQINYKTFEIVFTENTKYQNISILYPSFRPDIFSLLNSYR